MGTVSIDNKQYWADNLRVIATISVIFLHVTSPILYRYGTISDAEWWLGNVFDSIMRFCVPLFVMLTGALVLPKECDLNEFLKKALFRIVLPFVFWSFIYTSFHFSILILNEKSITLSAALNFILSKMFFGSSYHLWYVYMIIGIYLFVPIIGKWVRNATEKEIIYFLIIWSITIFLNLPFFSFFKTNIDLTYFSGYIGYLVLGYYLSQRMRINNSRQVNSTLVILALSGISVTVFGTYFLTEFKGSFDKTFYNYLTPNIAISSTAIFLLIKKCQISNPELMIIRDFISKYSYGMYLVHVLVLIGIGKFGINNQFVHPIFGIPIATFICLVVSGGIIYAINKFVPYGKFISG